MGWMEFVEMIGVTSKGELISVKVGQRPKGFLIGILITDPEHLTEENVTKIKLHFHGSDGQSNQHHCLSALNISQDQIDLKDGELTPKPKSITLGIPALTTNSLEKEFFPKYRDFFRNLLCTRQK